MTNKEYLARKHFGSAAKVVGDYVTKTVVPDHFPSFESKLGYFTDEGFLVDTTGDKDRMVA